MQNCVKKVLFKVSSKGENRREGEKRLEAKWEQRGTKIRKASRLRSVSISKKELYPKLQKFQRDLYYGEEELWEEKKVNLRDRIYLKKKKV